LYVVFLIEIAGTVCASKFFLSSGICPIKLLTGLVHTAVVGQFYSVNNSRARIVRIVDFVAESELFAGYSHRIFGG
jgi:hypothetical protein